MASRRTTRFAAAISVAALALSLTGGAVFAGEITGNGKSLKQDDGSLHGRSHCAFSGQNDDPSEGFPFGGRVQSYGYTVVKNGLKAMAPSPSVGCNPNAGFEE
jgi:hypothetical protein